MAINEKKGAQVNRELSGSRRIAVLPLTNISPDSKDQYFADGLTEELISTLSKIAGLKVIARTSVMRYKDTTKSIIEIGKELDVGTVLEGSLRKAGNKIRIAATLVDAPTEEHLWSETYDRELEDVFAIQSDIARRIAQALKVQIQRREKLGLAKKETENPEAYALYLQGRYFLNRRTEEGLEKAIDYFEQAIGKDSAYALAYTGLADSNAVMALLEFVPPAEAFPKARAAAERALEIERNLAEAHTSLGIVAFQYDWDWSSAEREFKRAIELKPNYPAAHQYYADFLKAMGRFEEAVEQMRQAQTLDPISMSINTGLGHVLYLSRQYDRAIEQYQKTIRMDPTYVQARLWFGRPYLQKGMYKEAIEELNQAVTLSKGSTVSLAMLGHALASSGARGEAERILQRLRDRSKQQYVPSYWIALIYVGLGKKKQAFEWLGRALKERSSWLAWIKVEPRYDVLRSDARFTSLLSQMHFSDDGAKSRKELGIAGWLKGPKQ